jgi:hypothetical protein
MNERATKLLSTADGQISELTALISAGGEVALSRPCPSREKLGDGTVAAVASHAAGNYHRIAGFAGGRENGGHSRIAKFLHSHGEHTQPGDYTAQNIDQQALLDRLAAARKSLATLGDLTDEQLDAVPPPSDMKFCDGKRTLEQIVTNLLNHQGHQIDAVRAALPRRP